VLTERAHRERSGTEKAGEMPDEESKAWPCSLPTSASTEN